MFLDRTGGAIALERLGLAVGLAVGLANMALKIWCSEEGVQNRPMFR